MILVIFFFQNVLLKILTGMPSECQTVWNQVRPNKMLIHFVGPITWFQTVCKDYRQTDRVNLFAYLFDLILYVPSTIFQLYSDRSSWVEPVLS